MITIKDAKFLTSAADKKGFIKSDKPIIAVCGKSNVGKSSFINMLANKNKLARTSAEPGRTRLVNYFDFGEFILADLPGYGFARVSLAEKQKWAKMLDSFFENKQSIAHVFALADIRHEPTRDDMTMIDYLYYNQIPFTVIATKSDKLAKTRIKDGTRKVAATLKTGEDNVIAVSSVDRNGKERVLCKIEQIIETFKTVFENFEADDDYAD